MKLNDLKIPEKEKKILEAAIAVISEKGFSASSTNEIARMAGVAEGTIFRYFKTKKDILRGIVIQGVNIVGEPIFLDSIKKILFQDDQQDLRAIIKTLLKNRIALINQFFPLLRIIITEAMYHEDIREILYEKIISKLLDIYKSFHRAMSAKGLMNKDLDPDIVARSIVGNLVVLFVMRNLSGPINKLEDFDRELDKVIDVIMYGISIRQTGDTPPVKIF